MEQPHSSTCRPGFRPGHGLLIVLALAGLAVGASGQTAARPPGADAPDTRTIMPPAVAAPKPGPQAEAAAVAPAEPVDPNLIDVQADNLNYDAARKLVIARGNVKVTRGTDSVSADYAEVDTAAEQVYARGHIVIEYLGNVWKGSEATYNFKTGVGDFGEFEAFAPPYHMTARDSRRASPRRMELDGIMLTTCEPDNPEYSIRASSASLEDNRILRAKNVRFQLGPVPFFYFPYMRANLEELAKFEFTPGYSSRMGAFLLTAYTQPLTDIWTSRTHVDVREKRGIGLGEDLLWKDPDGAYNGMLRLYYTHDNEPWKDEEERAEREELIDADRYWIQLKDRRNLTDRDYLISELNYVSDPWLLNDFFDDEYQQNVQPENRVTLSHRGDRYTAGVGVNMRLNDFYGNVNRLPEVFLNFNRQQIFGTPFYYEGENTLSYLDRVFPDYEDREDYDAFRFDTYNMVYWPNRLFGFLSVVPRGGYRGTYYSKTIEELVVTNVVAVTNELGEVTGTTNEVENLYNEADAVWRSLPEIGVETSFKAFGDLYRGPTGIEEDMDLRHIAEPYANYTLRFEPNALPDELYQFDDIDELDYYNALLLGMRNYLQTKRDGYPHNLIYLDVFTTLNMDPDEEEGEETLGDIGFKSELRPISWFKWDFDGAYDTQDSSIREFSTQAELSSEDVYSVGVDYRYKRDSRQAIAGDLVLFPEQRWSGRIYARMDLEESKIDEHSYYVIHRTRCLGIGLGLRVRPEYGADEEDDYTIWFRLWPLAFPNFASELGG